MQGPRAEAGAVKIVPLDATHLSALVDVHRRAYAGQVNFTQTLGASFIRKTYEWFLGDSKRYGFVACLGDDLIGCIIGADFRPNALLNRYRMWTGLRAVLRNPWRHAAELRDRVKTRKRRGSAGPGSSRKQEPSWEVVTRDVPVLWIYSLAVPPEYAPLRVAQQLFKASEQHAAARGKKFVLSSVGAQNMPSLWVHRSLGYRLDKKRSAELEKFFYKPVAAVPDASSAAVAPS